MKHESITQCPACNEAGGVRCDPCAQAYLLSKSVEPSRWRQSRWLQGIQDTSDGEIRVSRRR